MRSPGYLLASLILLACGDDQARDPGSGNSNSGITLGTGTPGTGTDSSGASTSSPATTTSSTGNPDPTGTADTGAVTGGLPKFDIGGGATEGTTGVVDKGCTKADFLFVIDNSASMEDNQAALVASFPGFITAIKATLSASSDYHVMIVDSDDDGRCKQPCNMDSSDVIKYCSAVKYEACNAKLGACDLTRGAGVVHPVGLYASNKVCPIAGGNRYMLPEEPDLEAAFACVATVGTAGNPSERPMNGMTEALSPTLNDIGGCNQGFLRDDAILVITFISDDPNYEDIGKPQEWYDAVVAAKHGNKDAIVVAGLIPQPDLGCAGGGNINGKHWEEFLGLWGEHGVEGSVCEPDYAPFFTQAIAVIDEACDNFMPPS